MLFREDERDVHGNAGRCCERDPAGFDGQDLGHLVICEESGDLVADLLHELRVDLLVQEASDLQDPSGQYRALLQDHFFHPLHKLRLSESAGERTVLFLRRAICRRS